MTNERFGYMGRIVDFNIRPLVGEPSYQDLLNELSGLEEDAELFAVDLINDEGYITSGARIEMLWLPLSMRAGIAAGADADWTDADSPEDGVLRWLDGDMRN
jgi:hypothetical protein